MTYTYKTKGVCSRSIDITVEDNIVKSVSFLGGCNGNLQGISRLVVGKTVDDVISILKGVNCAGKGTSCPDQLALALEEFAK